MITEFKPYSGTRDKLVGRFDSELSTVSSDYLLAECFSTRVDLYCRNEKGGHTSAAAIVGLSHEAALQLADFIIRNLRPETT